MGTGPGFAGSTCGMGTGPGRRGATCGIGTGCSEASLAPTIRAGAGCSAPACEAGAPEATRHAPNVMIVITLPMSFPTPRG
jgi:hypothetical protein